MGNRLTKPSSRNILQEFQHVIDMLGSRIIEISLKNKDWTANGRSYLHDL